MPGSVIGINKAGSNQGLAAEFVTVALSYDVQKTDLFDGFPVNNKALDEYVNYVANKASLYLAE